MPYFANHMIRHNGKLYHKDDEIPLTYEEAQALLKHRAIRQVGKNKPEIDEQTEEEKAEIERIAAEKAEAKRLAAEKKAAEKAEAERVAAEKAAEKAAKEANADTGGAPQ